MKMSEIMCIAVYTWDGVPVPWDDPEKMIVPSLGYVEATTRPSYVTFRGEDDE